MDKHLKDIYNRLIELKNPSADVGGNHSDKSMVSAVNTLASAVVRPIQIFNDDV